VHVHPRDAAKVLASSGERGHSAALGAYLVKLGAPIAELMQIGERYRKQVRDTALLDEVLPLEDGEELELRSFRATVMHTPGHTSGHIVLHAPGARVLFSADHLLGHISPCPLIELGPHGEPREVEGVGEGAQRREGRTGASRAQEEKSFRALVSYLESVAPIEALELDWVLPGHGEPFTGHRALIASLRAFYEERQARLLALLEPGPRTPYELAIAEFGPGRTDELFLTLSEMVGNLEVLEQRGRVERIAGVTPYRYRRM
jgi:glyoxylase-like metal-dependent hydrolase (beta-lactamase superfamily II)